MRVILDALLIERGLTPRRALETVSIEVGKRMVAAVPLVMACPDAYADTDNSPTSPYYCYPIEGVRNPRHFYACYRKNLYLPKYMHGFLDCLHDTCF